MLFRLSLLFIPVCLLLIIRIVKTHSLYFSQILEQFLDHPVTTRHDMKRAYLLGTRLLSFANDLLPRHPDYDEHKLRAHQDMITHYLEQVALAVDQYEYNRLRELSMMPALPPVDVVYAERKLAEDTLMSLQSYPASDNRTTSSASTELSDIFQFEENCDISSCDALPPIREVSVYRMQHETHRREVVAEIEQPRELAKPFTDRSVNAKRLLKRWSSLPYEEELETLDLLANLSYDEDSLTGDWGSACKTLKPRRQLGVASVITQTTVGLDEPTSSLQAKPPTKGVEHFRNCFRFFL